MPAADHLVPLGKARVDREGGDLTLMTYGQCLGICREAADLLAARGHLAEIVDLRSLSPLDLETCAASLRKTGRGICVQEASETGGVADTLIADLLPEVFGYLHAPLEKVAAAHSPVPSSPELEDAIMPSAKGILRKALALLSDY
jgi:pyruvate/2-oxoglutarate/acetoin dehydrogenase E1 component